MALDNLIKQLKPGTRIKRDAFLYFEPSGIKKNFAQCATCTFWTASGNCALMAGKRVPGEASCAMYAQLGVRAKSAIASYTPSELGYVDRPVRCENCKFGGKECELYKQLNKALPELFDLDAKIKPHGCCNANEPK